MGSMGIVFHACCLLETTTSCFLYRMMPIASGSGSTQTGNGSLASETDCRLPRTLSLPDGHKRYHASHNPHNTQNSPHRLKRVGPHVFGSTLETPLRIVHFSQTLVRGQFVRTHIGMWRYGLLPGPPVRVVALQQFDTEIGPERNELSEDDEVARDPRRYQRSGDDTREQSGFQ